MNRVTIKEYVDKRQAIENEIKLLREDMKELDAEYKETLDIKAVKAAIKILKLKENADENSIESIIRILEIAD